MNAHHSGETLERIMANINDLYKGRIVAAQTNQIGVMVRHYLVSAKAGTGATDQQIANALDAAVAAPLKALMASTVTYRGAAVQRIIPAPPLVEVFSVTGNGPGTATGDPLPSQVSGIISWRTANAGPFYRGRNYIPFPAEGDNDVDGKPTAGYSTRCGTLLNALVSFVAGSGGNTNTMLAVIYHRVSASYSLITAGFTQFRWATQRRRGIFGQANTVPF